MGRRILASLALDRPDKWSQSQLIRTLKGALSPEPLQFVGGLTVRGAIRRKEATENGGQRAHHIDRFSADLDPAGFLGRSKRELKTALRAGIDKNERRQLRTNEVEVVDFDSAVGEISFGMRLRGVQKTQRWTKRHVVSTEGSPPNAPAWGEKIGKKSDLLSEFDTVFCNVRNYPTTIVHS